MRNLMTLPSPAGLTRGLASAFGALAIVVGGFAGPGAALAQDAHAAPAAVPAAEGSGPALWVVRDEDSTLYLFGTVHMLKAGTAWGSPRVDAAFDSADTLWLEIANIDDQEAAMPLFMQHGLSMDRPLSTRLNETEFAALDAVAQRIGMSGQQLNPMRPWFAAMTLSLAPLMQAGYAPDAGVEMNLLARARAAGKPVQGLETYESQVAVFAGIAEDVELEYLRLTIADADKAVTMTDEMVAGWVSGDLVTLERVAVSEMKDKAPELYDALLTRRNTNWADQIQEMLEGSGTAFIAVGAGHLVGPDSVQAILEGRGVEVEQQ